MPIRAFTTALFALLVLLGAPGASASADGGAAGASPAADAVATTPDDDTPRPTFNDFYPDQRPLGDCLNNSIPLPNCGSEARGGWAQTTVFVAIIAGLAFIAWRIVAASRRARAELSRTPDATTAPDGDGGDPAP